MGGEANPIALIAYPLTASAENGRTISLFEVFEALHRQFPYTKFDNPSNRTKNFRGVIITS